MLLNFLNLLLSKLGLTKRKGRDTTEIIDKLIKLEEEKDKKVEEQTKQWLDIELKREQDRIECEEKHEERMLMIFSSFMVQMMQMTALQMYRNGVNLFHDYVPNYYSNMPYSPASQSAPNFNGGKTSTNASDSVLGGDHN